MDVGGCWRCQSAENFVVNSITCQRYGKYVIYTAITKLSVPASDDAT